MAKEKDKVPMVAQLVVTSSLGEEVVISFDTAWHRSLELPTPVSVKFDRFIRKPA